MWLYQIDAHSLSLNDVFISNGLYSGYPPHINKSNSIEIIGKGPLPPGDYTILAGFDHPHLGPLAMPLDPDGDNQMFGRGSFYIHGDSFSHPGFASEGCIIAPHEVRFRINASPDKLLRVTP